MGGESGLWGPGRRELQEGLGLIEESQALLRQILAGLLLQYASLDVQKQRLVRPEAPVPNPQCMQMGASLLTLSALLGFQRQTEALAAQAGEQGAPTDGMDVRLGAVSILITLIRFLRLAGESGPSGKGFPGKGALGQGEEVLAETELLSQPVE